MAEYGPNAIIAVLASALVLTASTVLAPAAAAHQAKTPAYSEQEMPLEKTCSELEQIMADNRNAFEVTWIEKAEGLIDEGNLDGCQAYLEEAQAQIGTGITVGADVDTEETVAPDDDAEARETFVSREVEREGYTAAQMEEVGVENLLGADVHSLDDALIGSIEDVIIGDTGEPEYVVIGVGGFLGIGGRQVRFGFDELTLLRDETRSELRVYLEATQEELEQTSQFEAEATAGAMPPEPRLRASRAFGGPEEYPPDNFAGYGVVAFNGRPTSERGQMFCEAYVGMFDTDQQLVQHGIPTNRQMVTVWPIETERDAAAARSAETDAEACAIAVSEYGLLVAEDAIEDANRADFAGTIGGLSGEGPYLLAWAPGERKGEPDVLVLVADLTNVVTAEQARHDFLRWKDDIQQNPELWERGWSLRNIQAVIQRWADGRSQALLMLIGLAP